MRRGAPPIGGAPRVPAAGYLLALAAASELWVGLDGTNDRAAEPSHVRRAVLSVLAERPDGGRQDVPEVPHAPGREGPERGERGAHRPERVELRADRRSGAARARGRVAKDLRAG